MSLTPRLDKALRDEQIRKKLFEKPWLVQAKAFHIARWNWVGAYRTLEEACACEKQCIEDWCGLRRMCRVIAR